MAIRVPLCNGVFWYPFGTFRCKIDHFLSVFVECLLSVLGLKIGIASRRFLILVIQHGAYEMKGRAVLHEP